MSANVAFIGLGLMGTGFTRRLNETGHTIAGYDVDAARLSAASAWGVTAAASPKESAATADIVMICVTTSKAMKEVVLGKGGLLEGSVSGKTIVDFSTCEIPVTRAVAEAVVEAGGTFIDAPVSGGPGQAELGTLAIMAGGSDAALSTARPVLENLGKVTHMGDVGAGQATKLVNQALCLTNYCVVAEGLRIAEAFGVDASKIPEALEPGLGNSAVLQAVYPRMVAEDFAPRGYARQILKDFEMLIEATREKHISLPMAFQAATLYRMLCAGGDAELDGSAVVKLIPKPE
ncbi:NAD(P)-dependent oxidoreductase [Acuticoccus sp. M5D2P5]|uniref:NAD(P)-dependent oxidoreductase n=1 Tax=Acuticoccus kalidii TaxID=2910977 RepID=UPI001F44A994|nr:NAD(P)-dependent oxidoreductase [Acuticoccus kalidii]MCF3934681.1 NAD(P)-dependent oxidoreductase [Acuticoccus kalidii]